MWRKVGSWVGEWVKREEVGVCGTHRPLDPPHPPSLPLLKNKGNNCSFIDLFISFFFLFVRFWCFPFFVGFFFFFDHSCVAFCFLFVFSLQ